VSAQCLNCSRKRKSIRVLAMSQKCRFCSLIPGFGVKLSAIILAALFVSDSPTLMSARAEITAMVARPRDIAAWPVEACDKAVLARIVVAREDDWDRTCGGLYCHKLQRSRRPDVEPDRSRALAVDPVVPPPIDIRSLRFVLRRSPTRSKPFRKASSLAAHVRGDCPFRNPITGIAGCCASPAESGHAAAAPPSSVMKSRLAKWPMGSPSEPAGPAYRRLRMPRKRGFL
jgi:hypothetical protein